MPYDSSGKLTAECQSRGSAAVVASQPIRHVASATRIERRWRSRFVAACQSATHRYWRFLLTACSIGRVVAEAARFGHQDLEQRRAWTQARSSTGDAMRSLDRTIRRNCRFDPWCREPHSRTISKPLREIAPWSTGPQRLIDRHAFRVGRARPCTSRTSGMVGSEAAEESVINHALYHPHRHGRHVEQDKG